MKKELKTWHFGIDNDSLINLVLKGDKRATTSIYEMDDIPEIGEQSILLFSNEKEACIVETKEVIITEFKNITPSLAYIEGEGDKSLEYWQRVHLDYFKSVDSSFDENRKVIFEIFEVVENLVEERKNVAMKIVLSNKDIFKEVISLEEINAGFNNYIFDVNNEYVIKICALEEKENQFETEYDFYCSNKENSHIPKLYKYDKSKSVVPYVYEIIEKIKGKSLYYYWYKMNEEEREKVIFDLMKIIKSFHQKRYGSYDWANKVSEEVFVNFSKCLTMFNEDEKRVMKESLKMYDEYLFDNRFALTHNDLHFDNILLEDNVLKLIDFNDSYIAPIDYDLRLLFMCKDVPWKWANIEMDPYQKPEYYQNIVDYILKYYDELNEIKYLKERMIIYNILEEIRNLPKYRHESAKVDIVSKSRKLLEKVNTF